MRQEVEKREGGVGERKEKKEERERAVTFSR